ncbi:hypothetical protein Xets_02577 [Xenorhabdus sp. TS4]|nr:hypothetical protein [Xenorhabdus sp. TS4]
MKVKYGKEEVKNPDDAKKKDVGDQTQRVESQKQRAEKGDKSWLEYMTTEPESAFNAAVENISNATVEKLKQIPILNKWLSGGFPQ